LGPAQASKTLL